MLGCIGLPVVFGGFGLFLRLAFRPDAREPLSSCKQCTSSDPDISFALLSFAMNTSSSGDRLFPDAFLHRVPAGARDADKPAGNNTLSRSYLRSVFSGGSFPVC